MPLIAPIDGVVCAPVEPSSGRLSCPTEETPASTLVGLGFFHLTRRLSMARPRRKRKPEYPSLSRWAKDNREMLLYAEFGKSASNSREWRSSEDYRKWKKAVLSRDRRCTNCGSEKKLQAHHIVPASVCPALRFDARNGRLLCKRCHEQDHMHQIDPRFWINLVSRL